MTILPKKPAKKEKSEVDHHGNQTGSSSASSSSNAATTEWTVHHNSHHGTHGRASTSSVGTARTRGHTATHCVTTTERTGSPRNSPPITGWEDHHGLAHHESRSRYSSSAVEEDDVMDTGATQSKRRYRSSPVRGGHRKRGTHHAVNSALISHDRESSPLLAVASGSAGPIPYPAVEQPNEPGSPTGHNSEDEYDRAQHHVTDEMEWAFEAALKDKKGFLITRMVEDGACLFRSVADQVYGDQEMHTIVRAHCMDYMWKNTDYFSQYVTEDFKEYVNRKRHIHCHGNHLEMQALSEMYNRSIEVHVYSTEPMNIFHGSHKTDNVPIRLSYHRNQHYNSIRDPYNASVGVGLGLPSFYPGLADNSLMRDALRNSEEKHIEKLMLEDKQRATDWEATNEAIEEQVARESYLEWVKEQENRTRKTEDPRATCSSSSSGANVKEPEVVDMTSSDPTNHPSSCSSATVTPLRPRSAGSRSPRYRNTDSPCLDPKPELNNIPPTATHSDTAKIYDYSDEGACCSKSLQSSPLEGASVNVIKSCDAVQQLPPTLFGLSDWQDEESILASVLAASQQEYLDRLKQTTIEYRSDSGSGSPQPSQSSQ